MKLISCYIEQYGSISKKTINFENITSFYEVNGYGKTTIASFIKAMFYGLESYKTNQKEFVDRLHFYPFNGGSFGGNITFSLDNGKIYKIERFFNKKSNSKDSFMLYCNGDFSSDFDGETIGKEIFGIDRASFERLLFINSSDIEIKSTSSINLKLNTLLDGNDDVDLDSIVENLDKVRKKYKNKNAKMENSLYHSAKYEADKLVEEINNIREIQASLDNKYLGLEELNNQIENLEKLQLKTQKLEATIQNWETYDSKQVELNNMESAKRQLEAKYPQGIPQIEDINALRNSLNERDRLNAQKNNILLSYSDELEFDRLNTKFLDNIPDEQTLKEIESKINELNKVNTQIDDLNSSEESVRYLSLKQHFLYKTPSNEEIDLLENKIEEYKVKKEDYEKSILLSSQMNRNIKGKSNKVFLIIALIFGVFTIASIPLFFINLIAGIVLISLGIIGLLVDAFLYLNSKSNFVGEYDIDKVNARKNLDLLESEAKAILVQYGYGTSNGIIFDFSQLRNDLVEFNDYKEAENKRKILIDQLISKKQESKEYLDDFFTNYQIKYTSYIDALSSLNNEIQHYRDLQRRKSTSLNQSKEIDEKIKEINAFIAKICNKYKLDLANDNENLDSIVLDITNYDNQIKNIDKMIIEIQNYKELKNLVERPETNIPDLVEINNKLSILREEKSLLEKQINSDELEVEKLGDKENELVLYQEKMKNYSEKHDIFEKTIASLKKAEQNLKDKYVGPIKDKFIQYSNVLEKSLGNKVSMSKDFEITFERNGIERSEKHLSSGNRSLCALCFRLALIDNMYSDEKPFLILDDPFVNLDDNHIKKALHILKVLSEKMQIIYFTCHESRTIG